MIVWKHSMSTGFMKSFMVFPSNCMRLTAEREGMDSRNSYRIWRLRAAILRAAILRAALAPPRRPRRATRPSRGAVERRLAAKRLRAEVKRGRRGTGEC